MIEKERQFIVVGMVQGERFTVIGRCGDLPIHVGDVFDAVYRYKRRRYPDELGDEAVREIEKPAAIRVISIHAYERCLQTLGQGMTGSLSIEGDGLKYIAPGWILGSRSEAPSSVTQDSESVATSV
jgi:hypothetical protein